VENRTGFPVFIGDHVFKHTGTTEANGQTKRIYEVREEDEMKRFECHMPRDYCGPCVQEKNREEQSAPCLP
jgi:hypothetical protein